MTRAPSRTFTTLPAGRGGSSTNPVTIARNRSRRALSPLSAEYERARANRGNRVSTKLRKLRTAEEYMNAANDAHRKAMEKAIRDKEEEVYQADRAAILQAYNTRIATGESAAASREDSEPEEEDSRLEEEDSRLEEEDSDTGSDEIIRDGYRASQLYNSDAEEECMEEDMEEAEEDIEERGEQEYVEHEAGIAASTQLDMEQRRRYYERVHAESLILFEQFARASDKTMRARLRRQRQKDS